MLLDSTRTSVSPDLKSHRNFSQKLKQRPKTLITLPPSLLYLKTRVLIKPKVSNENWEEKETNWFQKVILMPLRKVSGKNRVLEIRAWKLMLWTALFLPPIQKQKSWWVLCHYKLSSGQHILRQDTYITDLKDFSSSLLMKQTPAHCTTVSNPSTSKVIVASPYELHGE